MTVINGATLASAPSPLTAAQPRNQTGASQPTTTAPVGDQVQLSSGAHDVNPYEGQYSAANVTVDKWKKGPNDCLERILLNQGFSLHDIYAKKNGKTLLQQTAEANHLKDPNMVHNGANLVVPSNRKPAAEQPPVAPPAAPKPNTPEEAHLNTSEVKPGEIRTADVGTPQASLSAAVARDDKGSGAAVIETHPAEPEAALQHTETVSPQGSIDVQAQQVTPELTTATSVATSGDQTAQTTSQVAVTPDQSSVRIADTDATPGNMRVAVDNGHVTTVNPAQTPGDDIKTDTNIAPAHGTGYAARAGRWLNDNLLGADPQASLKVDDARQVQIDKGDTGASTVTVTRANGQQQQVTNPGESWLERRGENVDHAAAWTAHKGADAGRWIARQASAGWSWLKSW